MHEVWTRTRIAADSYENIPDEVCKAVLNTTGSGLNEIQQHFFKTMKYTYNETSQYSEGLPPLNDKESWDIWKNWNFGSKNFKSAGLFFHCIMKKYQGCNTKTVGGYSYTKVGSG